MINKKIFAAILILNIFFCFPVPAKIYQTSKINKLSYLTHLQSYMLPLEWILNFEKQNSAFMISMGSITSDEFSEIIGLKIKKQLNNKISFRYYYYSVDNPDIATKDNHIGFDYIFSRKIYGGIFTHIERQKENIDCGTFLSFLINKTDYLLRVNFKKFQFNRKTGDTTRYLHAPVEYMISITDSGKPVEKRLRYCIKLYYTPEFSFFDNAIPDSFQRKSETYLLNTIIFNNLKFCNNIKLNGYISYNKLNHYISTKSYRNRVYYQDIIFSGLCLRNKLSAGIRCDYSRSNTVVTKKRRTITPYFSYLHFQKEKTSLCHTFYYSKVLSQSQSLTGTYFIKLKSDFRYSFSKRSDITFILSLEKQDNHNMKFGGGCIQFRTDI